MGIVEHFVEWYAAPTIMAVVSAVYFFADRRRPAYAERFLTSAHGIVGVTLYVGAFAVAWFEPHVYRPNLAIPYLLLFLVPAASIGLALFKFRGWVSVHLLQVPNVLALLWAYFVGGMAVTGDWL